MDIEEIKKLPPHERIAKLKQLEEEHRKEIQAAEDLMRDSQREVTEETRRAAIPSEAVTADSLEQLFTEEERSLFEVKRFMQRLQPERKQEKKPESIEEIAEEAPKEKQEEVGVSYDAGMDSMKQRDPADAYKTKEKEDDIKKIYESKPAELYEREEEEREKRTKLYDSVGP